MTKTACPCDDPPIQQLQIPAGQTQIARQTQTFPEVRRSLLGAVPSEPPLKGWRARGERESGRMWLEMWAYVADVLGFYDERIANESYIRTAVRRPSLRRIVGMLGYVPAPGSAGSAVVAAIAEGKTGITVPKLLVGIQRPAPRG